MSFPLAAAAPSVAALRRSRSCHTLSALGSEGSVSLNLWRGEEASCYKQAAIQMGGTLWSPLEA